VSVIVIISIILYLIALLIAANILSKKEPQISDLNPPRPEVWLSIDEDNGCNGYQFPSRSSISLGIPTFDYDTVSSLVPFPNGYSCIWPDQMNESLFRRQCLSETCTGINGQEFVSGQIESYYSYCSTDLVRCSGTLGVIVVGYVLNSNDDILCVASDRNYRIYLSKINLEDQSQIFIPDPYQGNIYLTRLYQRQSGFCLYYESSGLLLGSCSTMVLGGYQWLNIPSMTFTINGIRAKSAYQLGYLGNIPSNVVQNVALIKSLAELRAFIITNNVQVLYLSGTSVNLTNWYYVPVNTGNPVAQDPIVNTIPQQNSLFVKTNNLGLFKNLLLLSQN